MPFHVKTLFCLFDRFVKKWKNKFWLIIAFVCRIHYLYDIRLQFFCCHLNDIILRESTIHHLWHHRLWHHHLCGISFERIRLRIREILRESIPVCISHRREHKEETDNCQGSLIFPSCLFNTLIFTFRRLMRNIVVWIENRIDIVYEHGALLLHEHSILKAFIVC